MANETIGLIQLKRELADAVEAADSARIFEAWRAVLVRWRQISAARTDPEPTEGESEYRALWELAHEAIANLGGQAEPPVLTLKRYDQRRYGPMLGVSDEGSATAAIRRGALAGPKCQVVKPCTPLTIGVAHDAERLGAVGEVVVGPDEYADIRLACAGRIFSTTNVGTRANVRHFLPVPEIRVGTEASLVNVLEKLRHCFAPFLVTPSGRARRLTVFVQFDDRVARARRVAWLNQITAEVARGKWTNPRRHQVGLTVHVQRGSERTKQAKAAIDLAKECGLAEIALYGPILGPAREAISLPGLLNHFFPDELRDVLRYAAANGIRLRPRQEVDPQTTARHIWTGLAVARNMGIELGKYGLMPLTFEEQHAVIVRIQRWVSFWCAAPVYYLDFPLVTKTDVYFGSTLAQGVRRWLQMVAKLGVRVVLIDTAKKSEGRRLLKDGPGDDKGFLSLDEIRDLNELGEKLAIKVLWAGGITIPQSYEFGRLGVFGIYVTSAVAALAAVGRKYRHDPHLTAMREPTAAGVTRVKRLLEAGFLVSQLSALGADDEAKALAAAAAELIASLTEAPRNVATTAEIKLHDLAVQGWQQFLKAAPVLSRE